jgi:hypothetical protein
MELDPVVTGTFTLAEPEPEQECILDSVPVKSMMLQAKKRQDFVRKFLLEKRLNMAWIWDRIFSKV